MICDLKWGGLWFMMYNYMMIFKKYHHFIFDDGILISDFHIGFWYRKVSILGYGIDFKYQKLLIVLRGIDFNYRIVSIPGFGIDTFRYL